jgi:hypothetical protein
LLFPFGSTAHSSIGQLVIAGTVYDSTKTIPVEKVLVKSGSGNQATTDSMGHYEIFVTENDSLTFIYQNKPTAKFAVKQIPNIAELRYFPARKGNK